MVERWERYCKFQIRVPWRSGERVNRIDLAIKDLSIIWEEDCCQMRVEIERSILCITPEGEVIVRKDSFQYQESIPLIPEVIRFQPLLIRPYSNHIVLGNIGEESYLEQGISLLVSAWQRKTANINQEFLPGTSLEILGYCPYHKGKHLETRYFFLSDLEVNAEKELKVFLSKQEFRIIPPGINFRGELLFIYGEKKSQTYTVSLLIPEKTLPNTRVEGKALINRVTLLEGRRVLILIEIEWYLIEEKPLQVMVSPSLGKETFYLWEMLNRKKRLFSEEVRLKLEEEAKVIEEIIPHDLQITAIPKRKGLLLSGCLELEIFYINRENKEKWYQHKISIEKWLEEIIPQENEFKMTVDAIRVKTLKAIDQELRLFVEIDYILTILRRKEVTFLPPTTTGLMTTILLEKIITQEPVEYYVEIPINKPEDFGESIGLFWVDGKAEGDPEKGGILIKAEPIIMWEYKNKEKKVKAVEINPLLRWFQNSPFSQREYSGLVEIKCKQMNLKENRQGELFLQLLVSGNLIIFQQVAREVELARTTAFPNEVIPVAESLSMKWEEQLPISPGEVLQTNYFLADFRMIKMEDYFLLEGWVLGDLFYSGLDGRLHYHRIKKDFWVNLPENEHKNQIIIPVLTDGSCSLLTNWKWEEGGVWCETSVDLQSFRIESDFKEVN